MKEMDNLDFGWEEPTHSLSSLLEGWDNLPKTERLYRNDKSSENK